MKRSYFSRRSFLAATGLSAAMVPLMARPGQTQAATPIRRCIFIGVPNGYTDKWRPVGGETDWTINPDADSPLRPLEPHRSKLNFVGGLWLKNGWDTTHVVPNKDNRFGPGSIGGHAAPPILLTGPVGAPGPEQFDNWMMTAGGPSIDSYIANNQAGAEGVKFKPLALRATRRNSASSFISFQGAPITPGVQNTTSLYDDPVTLFKDMFGDASLDAAEFAKIVAGRKHILDFTTGHLQALRNRFGATNKARIEAHLTAVSKAAGSLTNLATCQPPAAPNPSLDYLKPGYNDLYPEIIKTQIDMTVVGMACDLTRSVSMLWSDGANDNIAFPWLKDKDPQFGGLAPDGQIGGGQIRSHHNIAHHDYGALKNYSDQWFIQQYAYLLDRLTQTMDADNRPLIETTVVVYCNMQNSGGGHGTQDLFWILGGNHDNYFKTGRHLRWAGGQAGTTIPQNQVLTSLINSSGCPQVAHFGDAKYGGELTTLRA